MADAVTVRCPSCLREHRYAAPVFPCTCGAPVSPPLARTVPPAPLLRRTWREDWVSVRCPECARVDDWPQPELGCPCGALLRMPVRALDAEEEPDRAPEPDGPPPDWPAAPPAAPSDAPPAVRPAGHVPLPRTAATPRPGFRPLTIRTARDAVNAAALYLTWLGFRDVVQQVVHRPDARGHRDGPGSSGVDLRGPGVFAQVEPSVRRATLREVECLWLNGLSSAVTTVYFSLAGYTDEARARADRLGIPLFVLDLTGTPQPVNEAAAGLVAAGAPADPS
ncbi:hypothetical protein ACH41E_22855 [Streptomyces sp. NPDC020412]|uniref:hypothetical protein n=1 Tax=Streptomyces sp. NPDC020412 TaxID=3365073 RepID=UPI00379E0699